MGTLTMLMLAGAYAYSLQLREGLGVTGMSDHVSWGLYISNFTFLVGLAAAAMMLVMPRTSWSRWISAAPCSWLKAWRWRRWSCASRSWSSISGTRWLAGT
jgi:hypothetical protein